MSREIEMDEWRLQLEKFEGLLSQIGQCRDESGKLRFSRSTIIASDVASQFYCEKKVEMQYLHGKVETEEKRCGSQAHENMTEDSLEVKSEELWQKIYGEEPIYALEMFLAAQYQGVMLAGAPDSVLFRRGRPQVVLEYKFSRSRLAYPSYHVQAQTYGILLENMGFDISELFYAIVVADPSTRGSSELREKVLEIVSGNGLEDAELVINDYAAVYMCRFRREDAEKHLSWALEYWTGSRDAVATENPNKCLRCEYREKCRA